MGEEETEENISVSRRLLSLLLLGITLVFAGITVLVIVSLVLGGSGSVGGVILIGPVPIIFGAGENAGLLILFGATVTVLSLILFFVLNRRVQKK